MISDRILQLWRWRARRDARSAEAAFEARRLRLHRSGLFDPDYYLRTNPDVAREGLDPLTHYLENGFSDGRDPHPLFSQAWYRAQLDAQESGAGSWLEDYLTRRGRSGIDPHPLFDSAWYCEQAREACEGELRPLQHYLAIGAQEGLSPNRLFDPAWYRKTYPEVADRGIEPLTHFAEHGTQGDYNPGPDFNSRHYLAAYDDVRASGLNPLVHYLHTGRAEGREPRPHPPLRSLSETSANLDRLRAAIDYDPGDQPRWHQGKQRWKGGCPVILLVGHSSGPELYGAERSFLDLLHAMGRLAVNVLVVLPGKENAAYHEEVLELCAGAYEFAYPLWRDDRGPIERLVLVFSRIILDHDVQLVYANTITVLEPLVAARRLGVKSAIHARELVAYDDRLCAEIGRTPSEIIAAVFERCDFVVGNSKATCSAFARPGRTFCVPNAIDISRFQPSAPGEGPLRFGIVSSNSPKKGLRDFVEIARMIGRELDQAEFVVIGPETRQTRLWQEEIEAGTLPSNLKFLGYRDTPQAAMSELDVLLNLSAFAESFGRTVAEAAAAGKPAIAYHWGALPEVVVHAKTGYLAGYRDLEDVARRVRELAGSRARVREMGEAARAHVEAEFSRERLDENLEAALLEMLGPHVRKAAPPARVLESPPAARHSPVIVVPVFNAFEAFEACLAALQCHTRSEDLRAVIVDDASTDERVRGLLETLEHDGRFEIISNRENQGYTRSINTGIRAAGGRDIVLLNSDAVVTPNWLDGLMLAACREGAVGTVTAMSDNAGAFSFPEPGEPNPLPPFIEAEAFARAVVQATGACTPVEVPTGSGFCMFIKAELIEDIGLFDEDAFPRGYGEENDFCMRARAAGWKNVITPWAYVYHVRSASFGQEKHALLKAGVDEVIRRYPDYPRAVEQAFSSQAMTRLRDAARLCYS